MSNYEQDDLMLSQAFQKSYQNIKMPEDLKQATLSEMMKNAQQTQVPHQEDVLRSSGIKNHERTPESGNKGVNKNAKKAGKKLLGFGSAVAVLGAAALAFLVLRPSGVSYITPMEEGVYYDTVELKNGEIHFVKNRVAISITPNAGQVVIGGDSVINKEEEQKTEVLEETVAESGGLLVFQETEQVSLPEIAEDNWSNIGEQMIYVTVLKTEEIRYQAVFEKNGTAYQVIGTDVTQKEFIDYLNDKINE